MLGHIITDYNKDFPWIELINDYEEITDEYNKKFFTCSRPCAIESLDNSNHIADITTIVHVDISKAVGHVGNAYKIPRNAVKGVAQ